MDALTESRVTIYGGILPPWEEGHVDIHVSILIKVNNEISQQSGIKVILTVADADLYLDKVKLFYFFLKNLKIKYFYHSNT